MKLETKEYNAKYWKKWRLKNRPYKQKICVICKNKFNQTGNTQIRCTKCQYLTCEYCNKKFIPTDSNYKRKFCSQKCYSSFRRGQYPKNLKGKRGTKPRTWHLNKNKRPLHAGAIYKDWQLAVFKRDKYKCQKCGKTSNELKKKKIKICADHIKPYCNYPELRYEVSNGRTLCVECHKKTKTYGIKAKFF